MKSSLIDLELWGEQQVQSSRLIHDRDTRSQVYMRFLSRHSYYIYLGKPYFHHASQRLVWPLHAVFVLLPLSASLTVLLELSVIEKSLRTLMSQQSVT
jgi:hypothetical protein